MSEKTTVTVHPFIRVRRAGVPLSQFETADPAAKIAELCGCLNGAGENTPLIQWDCVRGLSPVKVNGKTSAVGREWCQANNGADARFLGAACVLLADVPPVNPGAGPIGQDGKPSDVGGVVFFHNAHLHWAEPEPIQALWNLRDAAKVRGLTVVLLSPGAKLPVELRGDVVTFDEPAPGPEQIAEIAAGVASAGGIDAGEYDPATVVNSCLGYLEAFTVENAVGLSITKTPAGKMTFDPDTLWRLKVANLKQTAGLEITLPKAGFAELQGADGYKALAGAYLRGRKAPRCILWLDEIEKMLAGSTGGDLSGTSQAMLEQFLFWTQAREVDGLLLLGIPGAGKSYSIAHTAGEAEIPCMRASMSAAKGGIVGQSEAQMGSLLKAVDAVGQGRVLMIATCNSLDGLAPEVIARFRLGVFFYDYPSEQERAALWTYYTAKFGLPAQPVPPSINWVGREIASCCERAWLFNCTLAEAARSVIPVCTASGAKMEALRKSADGRFLSASRPGKFTLAESSETVSPVRKFNA